MPKLRVLSGDDVIKIILSFGFIIESQRGSHVKLARFDEEGTRQTLIIPQHKEIDKGTLKSIFRQSSKYIDESELKQYFYSD